MPLLRASTCHSGKPDCAVPSIAGIQVLQTRRWPRAVGRPAVNAKLMDHPRMAVEDCQVLLATCIPEPDGPVGAARCDPEPVEAVRRRRTTSPIGVARKAALTSRPVSEFLLADGPIRRRRHDALSVRTERDPEYLARMPATFGGFPAGGCIPQPCSPHPRKPAAQAMRSSIGTEYKVPDLPNEGTHGRPRFVRTRIVHDQDDLLWPEPAYGHARPVWARTNL